MMSKSIPRRLQGNLLCVPARELPMLICSKPAHLTMQAAHHPLVCMTALLIVETKSGPG
jgi:hypothetical protein